MQRLLFLPTRQTKKQNLETTTKQNKEIFTSNGSEVVKIALKFIFGAFNFHDLNLAIYFTLQLSKTLEMQNIEKENLNYRSIIHNQKALKRNKWKKIVQQIVFKL